MSKKISWKSILAISMVLVLFGGSAMAGWTIKQKNKSVAKITSDENGLLYFVTDLGDLGTINVTNSSETITKSAIVHNSNGDLNVTFTALEERIDDTSDTCTDYLNDVEITYRLNSVEIINNQTVIMQSGQNDLEVEYFIHRSACPGDINVTVQFEEVSI